MMPKIREALYTIAFFAMIGAAAIVAGTAIMMATYYTLIQF